MAELIEITRALELVQEFSPLRRILLTCSGTLQGTLSAFFRAEVKVRVLEQRRAESLAERIRPEGDPSPDPDGLVIRRVVDLYTHLALGSELSPVEAVVCHASSGLSITRLDIREKVLSQELGIGQILEVSGVRPSFELLDAGQDYGFFWRRYKLAAPGVEYFIHEVFPQELYP